MRRIQPLDSSPADPSSLPVHAMDGAKRFPLPRRIQHEHRDALPTVSGAWILTPAAASAAHRTSESHHDPLAGALSFSSKHAPADRYRRRVASLPQQRSSDPDFALAYLWPGASHQRRLFEYLNRATALAGRSRRRGLQILAADAGQGQSTRQKEYPAQIVALSQR